jgi:hypothetical protein
LTLVESSPRLAADSREPDGRSVDTASNSAKLVCSLK